MNKITITDNIKYIGVDDKDIDLFESQYIVPNGISYNSYLIKDEKNVVMDTVDKRKTNEWLKKLEEALEEKYINIDEFNLAQNVKVELINSLISKTNKYIKIDFTKYLS